MHEVKGKASEEFKEMKEPMHKLSEGDIPQKQVEEDKLHNDLEASLQVKVAINYQNSSSRISKRQFSNPEVQNSLKQEILQLHKRLQDQKTVRYVLDKASHSKSLSFDEKCEAPMLKIAGDLIKEIAVLEVEIVHLEKYLLSLYRKTFDRHVSTLSNKEKELQLTSAVKSKELPSDHFRQSICKKKALMKYSDRLSHHEKLLFEAPEWQGNENWGTQKILDSGIQQRSHSSLSQRSACGARGSQKGVIAEAIEQYHSLPLSMLERHQDIISNTVSLAEDLGDNVLPDHILDSPNSLSEEMVRCISTIYCGLADPPLSLCNLSSSPVSCSSSMYELSPGGHDDMWSQSLSSQVEHPFGQFEEPKEFNGPYCTMTEVKWICRDSKKLREIEPTLKRFRSLISCLEDVDPRKMKHEQKLAFWINVHNALLMHAYMVYGIPQNSIKRMSLILKAAYNVGGQILSVEMIQRSILGCRLPRPGQWLQFLFYSKPKFRVGDSRRLFAIDHPEPLLHFALCSGNYSDPAVRIYTPKRVFLELEAAKEEYIQLTSTVSKDQKILLPKILETFAKDADIPNAAFMEMIEPFLPHNARKSIEHQRQRGRIWKCIEWTPHNFAFRYLLSKELAAN